MNPNNSDGSETQPTVDLAEHTSGPVSAKKVIPYGLGVNAVPEQLPTPFIDVAFDTLAWTNPDVNNNYRTLTASGNGSTVATFTITYDSFSNITMIQRTSG